MGQLRSTTHFGATLPGHKLIWIYVQTANELAQPVISLFVIPALAWAVSQHTDTSKNTKAWTVSQHTDTSKNTEAWGVSQQEH